MLKSTMIALGDRLHLVAQNVAIHAKAQLLSNLLKKITG